MPLDPETYLKATAALDRAHRSGWDPVEHLDRLGLVLSPAQRTDIQGQILTSLLVELGTWRPVELLRRKYHAGHQCAPADMYVVILEFIEEYRNKIKEEG